MKNILLLFAIAGTLFACSKDDDKKEQSLKEIVEIEKLKVDQDSINNLLIGTWEGEYQDETRRLIISKNHFVLQRVKPNQSKPIAIFDCNSFFFDCNPNFPNVYQIVDLTNIDINGAQSILIKIEEDKLLFEPFYYIYYDRGRKPDNFKNLDAINSVILTKIN